MRQPLSIYVRGVRLEARRFATRALRKLHKMVGKEQSEPRLRESRQVIELSMVDSALSTLGIGLGDRLLVHSGISNLGKVKGGPSGVLRLLRERVGDSGLLLFPAFPFDTLMHEYVKSNPEFDPHTSPTAMGALATLALSDSQRARSLHPTHSVCGFGSGVREFLDGHHLDDTPFGPHSPFWRLADVDGKILVIGVGLSSVTSFHMTEDHMGNKFPVSVYLDEPYRLSCRNNLGEKVEVMTRCHDPAISRLRDCYIVEDRLMQGGIYQKMPVGQHHIGVIDARAMDECLQDLAQRKHLTIYGRIWG